MKKHHAQKERDSQKFFTYTVTFPPDIKFERQVNLLELLHGSFRNRWSDFTGSPTMLFETWGTAGKIMHRIRLPESKAEEVSGTLWSMIPGAVVELEDDPPDPVWTKAVELGLKNPARPLHIPKPDVTSTGLMISLGSLVDDEKVVLRWTVTATHRQKAPIEDVPSTDSKLTLDNFLSFSSADSDEISQRRKKLDEPNFMAQGFVGVYSPDRADYLLKRVSDQLSNTSTAQTYFVRKQFTTAQGRQQRYDGHRAPLFFPVQLMSSELAALIAWPVDSPRVPGLTTARATFLPPTHMHETDGIIIGKATWPGQERPIAISYEAMRMHLQLLGRTGTGKSETMASIARQAMEKDYGLILMEKEGDLADKVLDYVPRRRWKDVIFLDMRDTDRPLGFNVLDQGNRNAAVQGISSLIKYQIGEKALGVWANEMLSYGLQTIADTPGLNILDVLPLMNPDSDEEKEWADAVIRQLKDPELVKWWRKQRERRPSDQAKRAEPMETRMASFMTSRELRYIIGQSKSSFTWDDVLQNNKILIISFKGAPDNARGIMCAMFMESLWRQIKDQTTPKERPTFLMIDESAEFMNQPNDLQAMFEQARKFNISITVANQQISQLQPVTMQKTIMNNARSKIVFSTYADDGNAIRRELAGGLQAEHFTQLARFEAIVQPFSMTGVAPPVTVRTLAPTGTTGVTAAIKERNRMELGRPVAEVQREIEDRRRPYGAATRDAATPYEVPEISEWS